MAIHHGPHTCRLLHSTPQHHHFGGTCSRRPLYRSTRQPALCGTTYANDCPLCPVASSYAHSTRRVLGATPHHGLLRASPPDGNGRALRLLAPQWLELDGTLLPLQPALPLPPPHLRLYLGTSPDTYALALAGYRLYAQPRGTLLLSFLCPVKRRLHAALPHGTRGGTH